MTRVMSLPMNTVIEYKAHNVSLKYVTLSILWNSHVSSLPSSTETSPAIETLTFLLDS